MTSSTPIFLKPVDHNPFSGPDIELVVPAIQPQVEIFTSCLMGGEDANRSYNESVSLRLLGSFNQQAMFRALQDVVQRHESLRCNFSPDGSQVFIQSALHLHPDFRDLSHQSKEKQRETINEFRIKEAEKSFDLLNGPLIRVALFRLAAEEHYLTLTAHHIICDGWSIGILMQDLSKYYSAYVKDYEVHLGEAPRFSKYAIAQAEFLQTDEYMRTEQFWIKQYIHDVPRFSLSIDFPRPPMRTYGSHREDFPMNTELVASIKKLSVSAGCSFVTTLVTLFKLYMHRLSNQDDIVLGLPAAGQSVTGNYGLIGHCVNLLPLRSTIEKEDSFLQYLHKQKRLLLDAFDHQQFTFSNLLQKLPIVRDPSRIPLVPYVFNVDLGMDDNVKFEGLQHELISNPRAYEAFEIFVNASGTEQRMTLEWSYNTQLFRSSTIKAMMHGFEGLIQTAITNPGIRVHDIAVKDPTNAYTADVKNIPQKQIFVDYPNEKALYHLIDEKVKHQPRNVAVCFDKHLVTYQELGDLANQLASVLIENNVQPGDIVGVALERSHKMVIALLAIMKTGAAYLPLDPDYPKDRIEFMLADASPKIVLTSKGFQGIFHSEAKEIVIENIWPTLKKYSKKNPSGHVKGDDIVYILYTSGSTGRPKGVRIAHHNLVNCLVSLQKRLSVNRHDKFLGLTTLSFDISAFEIYLPLISGASVTILSSQVARDGNLLLDALKNIRPSVMQATPSTWQMLLEAGWNEDVVVETVCSGGEALVKELAIRLGKRSRNLYNLYGPTETTVWSTIKKVDAKDEIVTIGRPIDNTQILILDNNRLPVPQNSAGEIYIGGEGVAKGYLKRPELTHERFVVNPFADKPGERLYRTGDLGRMLPNGEIEYLGRADHQIKIRGHRIEPGEIEHCLVQQKDVKASVVIAREDHPGDARLTAYVVLRPAAESKRESIPSKIVELGAYRKSGTSNGHRVNKILTHEALIKTWKQALRQSLPGYMIPSDFVILEALPLTPNGKLDRKALPIPDTAGRLVAEHESASNTLEASLIEIWKRLLRVDKISIHDRFFEIGGHSLLAMRLISVIREEMGVEIPLFDIFGATVQTLAMKINSLQPSGILTSEQFNSRTPALQPRMGAGPVQKFEGSQLEWGINGNGKYKITIREGGAKIPVFGIISFYSYELLAGYMMEDQPLYYFPPTRSASVKTIASHYIREIKNTRPVGPYCIAGFCHSGSIAFEIAQQLQSQGDTVSALILFEFYSPHAIISKRSATYIKRRLSYYKQRLHSLAGSSGSPLISFSRMIRNSIDKIRDSYLEPPPPKFLTSKEYEMYEYKPYAGKVILFKAGNPPLEVSDSPLMGWSGYFTGDVEQITIDGGHLGIFREPAIRKLAQELNVVLEKLNCPAESTSKSNLSTTGV